MWVNRYHSPNEGDKNKEYIYHGVEIILEAKLNRTEGDVKNKVEQEGE
jgi:hypothetical protein